MIKIINKDILDGKYQKNNYKNIIMWIEKTK